MIDFLKSIGINLGLTIAGFFGALLLAPKMKNWKMQLIAVLSGTLSATYIAPVIIGILNIKAPNIEYGLAVDGSKLHFGLVRKCRCHLLG